MNTTSKKTVYIRPWTASLRLNLKQTVAMDDLLVAISGQVDDPSFGQ